MVAWVGYVCGDAGESVEEQRALLRACGCERVFEDAGAEGGRPGLAEARAAVDEEDVLVVTSLERLSGCAAEAVAVLRELAGRGVRVRVTQLSLDTGTPEGRLLMRVLATLEEWGQQRVRELA